MIDTAKIAVAKHFLNLQRTEMWLDCFTSLSCETLVHPPLQYVVIMLDSVLLISSSPKLFCDLQTRKWQEGRIRPLLLLWGAMWQTASWLQLVLQLAVPHPALVMPEHPG